MNTMSSVVGTYEAQTAAPAYQYGVYGIFLRSDIPLLLPEHLGSALAEIELRSAPAGWFADLTRDAEIQEFDSSWYQYACLQDRSTYARWGDVGEFLVSADGKTIVCRQSNQASGESFRVYLLGQALSFALVKQGFEPLHATTVVVNGEAAVFLGDGGFGKSSLAACFLAAGHRILTDDLLILRETSKGILAYPGPDRIKLFPRVARKFLGEAASHVTMNTFTRKMIVPLRREQACATPVPLGAIYAIAAPRQVFRKQAIRIETLSPREAFFELVKNTFNYRIVDGERLERQFIETEHLVDAAPVKKLSYPRALDRLPAVRDAILCDLCREFEQEEAAICAD
jgi:hypothetical protein